ncbi:MAG TPA: methionyl-tRNA formyltransferase [Acidimicrobiales bacterium]|nr:methionyl-tRNA formyltransferase [Acidimicrobiales bacterium]
MAKLAFLGTPQMAVPPLRALVDAGHEITLCVTRPDRRRGRRGHEAPSPVKEAATALGLPVSHDMHDLLEADAELAVVVAFGRIIPADILAVVPMVNLHFSLLPRWRGAAPVERAILAGDRETGVCVMKVEEGLDTGPVYAVRTVPLDDDVTLAELRERLTDVGAALLVEVLAGGIAALPQPQPQRGEPTIATKITPAELELRWEEPAVHLARVVRLGRAWTTFRGKRLGVLDAAPEGAGTATPRPSLDLAPGTLDGLSVATGEGTLRLRRVQPESRSPMSADDWIRGVRPVVGERLGTD